MRDTTARPDGWCRWNSQKYGFSKDQVRPDDRPDPGGLYKS